MDYDYRNKSGPAYPRPMFGPSSASPSPSNHHPMYGPPGYPNIGQQTGHGQQFFPPPERNSSFQHNTSSSSCKSRSDLELGFTRMDLLIVDR